MHVSYIEWPITRSCHAELVEHATKETCRCVIPCLNVDIAISCIAYGRKASLIIISLSDCLIIKSFLKNVQWLETSTCRIVYIHELQI